MRIIGLTLGGVSKQRLEIVIPIAICLSFILSTGPHVQEYLVSLINSERASIYDSVFNNRIIIFPTLYEWMASGLQWNFLIMGAIVSIVSLRRAPVREVMTWLLISSLFVLIANDLLVAVVANKLNSTYIFENIVSNIVGAIAIAIIVVAILAGCDVIFSHVPASPVLRRMTTAITSVFAGVLISLTVFYLAKVFYQPTPVEIDVQLDRPVSGVFDSSVGGASDDIENRKNQSTPPFSLIPSHKSSGTADWLSQEGVLKADWNAPNAPEQFDVMVSLYGNCVGGKAVSRLHGLDYVLKFENVKLFSIWFERGVTGFATIRNERSLGRFALESRGYSSFAISPDEVPNNVKVGQFVDEHATLRYWDTDESPAFYLYAPLLSHQGAYAALAGRMLHIQHDGEEQLIEFSAPQQMDWGERIACSEIRGGDLSPRKHLVNKGPNLFVGAVVQIVRNHVSDRLYNIDDSVVRVSGGQGWINIGGFNTADLLGQELGWVTTLNFKGNVAKLMVDESSASPSTLDDYFAIGKLRGTFGESGQLRFVGEAKAFAKDGSRVNPTRWERLPVEFQVLLISLIVAFIGFILRIVFRQLQGGLTFRWLLS